MRKVLFDELLESVNQMKAIHAGRLKPSRVTNSRDLATGDPSQVADLRARFKLSQSKFAALLGISIDTLQNWEQGRRQPEGPARVLLKIAAAYPEALLAVSSASKKPRARKSA